MRIYHGSKDIIERPVFGRGKAHNDYGLGFYCTEDLRMAKEWAVDENHCGYANAYDLNMDGLDVLRLGGEGCTVLHWLAVLLENRTFDMPSILAAEAREYLLENFSVPYKEADIIVGYRADDSYFSFAQDFLNGTIPYRHLRQAMHLGKLGQQVVLKSERAFARVEFCDALPAPCELWFPKKQARDLAARQSYTEITTQKRKQGDLYMVHILDEGILPDDPRLR